MIRRGEFEKITPLQFVLYRMHGTKNARNMQNGQLSENSISRFSGI